MLRQVPGTGQVAGALWKAVQAGSRTRFSKSERDLYANHQSHLVSLTEPLYPPGKTRSGSGNHTF